jgi:uncharacterized HhH-GPD family protein
MATKAKPDRLHYTGDAEADALLAQDPFALLVGIALDQQVPTPTAFSGPLKLKQRLGTLDAREIAATDPSRLEEVFRERPAIHRFPGNMARRVHELAGVVAGEFDGDASRLWRDASGPDELRERIAQLPGFGDMKVKLLGAILDKRFGVEQARGIGPDHITLGDVDSTEALERYQAAKRERKARMRAAG